MNFLGMGPGELMLIAALGLIVFGPGKLPEIAAQLGKMVRDFRMTTAGISDEFRQSFSLEAAASTENAAPPEPEPEAAPETVGSSGNGAGAETALADTSEWHWESG